MKYIKKYETSKELRKLAAPEYITGTYTTFDLNELQKDCEKYNIDIFELVKEMVLNKKITFQCHWCYTDDKDTVLSNSHNIIGKCNDINYQDPLDYLYSKKGQIKYYSDILVKIENYNYWHTILQKNLKNERKQKVRIYDYIEGKLMKQLNILKSAIKYNL